MPHTKKLRQNGTLPGFSASFVKSIIDNPIYMGKIAYGRRRTEKKIGARNEMHVVAQSEFPVYEGQHNAIVSEEDWNLAHEKRKVNAYRREKVNDPEHAHILSGILKCPCCGKSLYGNVSKAHSKDKKTRYYYYCKNTVTSTGHQCTFRQNIEQTEMNRMVASIVSAMVKDPRFAEAIKEKIGSAVDTGSLEKQLGALQSQLRQALGTKSRLEKQMDSLDINDQYYNRKISDLQRRYEDQYGRIDEIESQIDDVQNQIHIIRQEKISGDNIYRLLLAFDQVYDAATEVERKEFMRAFIERIELFPEKQPDGNWIIPGKAAGRQLDQEDYLQLPCSCQRGRSERIALGKWNNGRDGDAFVPTQRRSACACCFPLLNIFTASCFSQRIPASYQMGSRRGCHKGRCVPHRVWQ